MQKSKQDVSKWTYVRSLWTFKMMTPGTFVAHFQQTVLNKKLNKLFSNKYMSEDL